MISKNQIKHINALQQKKYRNETGLFFAEGTKIANELLKAPEEVETLFATGMWLKQNKVANTINSVEVSVDEIKKISALTTPQDVLVVAKQANLSFSADILSNQLTLFLDDIRDPGNLGTIIRVADWFGIKNVVCSNNSVDVYNPKVIQATMGSFLRVNCFYTDIEQQIIEAKRKLEISVFATLLEGKNIYQQTLPSQAILVMGNEANGISEAIKKECTDLITIPSFNADNGAESLNVAIATAVFVSEFKRTGFTN